MDEDKLSAYQTLYTCLETVALLASPLIPFYTDRIFTDLNSVSGKYSEGSVHLAPFPSYDEKLIDKALEERMEIAQKMSSMILALRRKVNIRVRQPLAKIMVPVTDPHFRESFEAVRPLILAEVNVKDVEYVDDTSGILVRRVKPNFKLLGPKFGKQMKEAGAAIMALKQGEIAQFEREGSWNLVLGGVTHTITTDEVEIISEDIPGWLVANEGKLTVALDITVTEELLHEGIAREFVNRIQNIRKESGFEVTDKIRVVIEDLPFVAAAVHKHSEYIASQTLALEVSLAPADQLAARGARETDIEEQMVKVVVEKV
jgi:isoleucyl-tRNA synthetase